MEGRKEEAEAGEEEECGHDRVSCLGQPGSRGKKQVKQSCLWTVIDT